MALTGHGLGNSIVHLKGKTLLGQQGSEILQLQLNNPHQIRDLQRTETNDLIDAVEEFRPKLAGERCIHLLLQG